MRFFPAVVIMSLACAGLASCDTPPESLGPRAFLVTRASIALATSEVGVAGLDLDGVTSTDDLPAEDGACAHTDLIGLEGEPGVDSQLAMLGGAIALFGFGDINATLQQTINEGGLTILMELDEVASLVTDRRVGVEVFRGEGPVALGTNGQAEPGQSFDIMAGTEPSGGEGTIEDGVISFGPIPGLTLPLRFLMTTGDVRLTRMQGRFTIDEAGRAHGMLGGVVPIADIQALVARVIADGGGTGNASLLPILERALSGVADSDLDPETMRCTGITAGVEIEAVEAFILR
ncbi:MAG: hypothetical protein IPL19_30250 [Sandaracinaceae bacterium]|jgi:hypothetical protein|nr:hypothetical protein [Sandaracinaceae bacterium]MBK8412244.1 hypothetical protein [Sandaracinaceae bacterium]